METMAGAYQTCHDDNKQRCLVIVLETSQLNSGLDIEKRKNNYSEAIKYIPFCGKILHLIDPSNHPNLLPMQEFGLL